MKNIKKLVLTLAIFFLLLNRGFAITINTADSKPSFTISQLENWHRQAVLLARQGRFKKAINSLQQLVKVWPKSQVVADYIVVLCWAGYYNRALKEYERFFKSNKMFPPGYVYRDLGHAAYELGRYQQAIDFYKKACVFNPNDFEAFKGLVFSLCQIGKFGKARKIVSLKQLAWPQKLLLYFVCDSLSENTKQAYEEWLKGITQGVVSEQWEPFLEITIKKAKHIIIARLLKEFKAQCMFREVFLVEAIRGHFKKAANICDSQKIETYLWPAFYRYWVGWTYFKTHDYSKALGYFESVLTERPHYFRALLGKFYCLTAQKKFKKAQKLLSRLKREFAPRKIDLWLAEAYFWEQKKSFLKAIVVYEKILKHFPQNHLAFKLMLEDYSTLGLPSAALERLKDFKSLRQNLMLDEAAYRLRWGLALEAEEIIKKVLKENPHNSRALFDLVPVLAEQEKYSEAIKVYKDILKQGYQPPWWTQQNAAKAFLALDRHQEAIEIYQNVLKIHPSFKAKMGLFWCFLETHQWSKAWSLLKAIDKSVPIYIWHGNNRFPDWNKLEVALAKFWLLSEENRYKEAQQYLEALKQKAPGNNDIRSALGSLYFWRGWSRRALEELLIAKSRDKKDLSVNTSLAWVWDDLGYKKEARHLVASLYKKHPYNKDIMILQKKFYLDDRPQLLSDFSISTDDDGGCVFSWYSETNFKWTLNRRLFLYYLWNESRLHTKTEIIHDNYNRMGLGIREKLSPSWYWEGTISGDVSGQDLGVSLGLQFTPSDYWQISGTYNSFVTDVPIRARQAGIRIAEWHLGMKYRFSESREISLGTGIKGFSDGNERYEAMAAIEQNFWVKRGWVSRGRLEISSSHGTKETVPYFNPKSDFGITFAHVLQYTHFRYWNRYLISRLKTSIGMYHQQFFGTGYIGSVYMRQEYSPRLKTVLYWEVGGERNLYDGQPVHSLVINIGFRLRF